MTTDAPLVLGLFSGIGMLDRCFEDEGFVVVRGPDLLWGHDVKGWHPPPGRFDGLIAGVPCQRWSPLSHMVRQVHGEAAVAEDMFPEFERVAFEAQPAWFLTECSPFAPIPQVPGYSVSALVLDNRWIGDGIGQVQRRRRRFCFGTKVGAAIQDCSPDLAVFENVDTEPVAHTHSNGASVPVKMNAGGVLKRQFRSDVLDVSPDLVLLESAETERAVIASGHKDGTRARQDERGRKQTLPGNMPRRTVERCCELQGFPPDFLAHAPFTVEMKYKLIGNGVARPTGRAIARAVKRALGYAMEATA